MWVAHSRGIGSVLEIVGSTDLISTMPRQTTQSYLMKELTFLDIDHVQFRRPIGLIKRKDTSVDMVQTKFMETIIKQYG